MFSSVDCFRVLDTLFGFDTLHYRKWSGCFIFWHSWLKISCELNVFKTNLLPTNPVLLKPTTCIITILFYVVSRYIKYSNSRHSASRHSDVNLHFIAPLINSLIWCYRPSIHYTISCSYFSRNHSFFNVPPFYLQL